MYIPILKNRTVEVNTLKQLFQTPLSIRIMPLIEVIQERLKTTSGQDFIDDFITIAAANNSHRFLVDLVRINAPNNTTPDIKTFILNVTRKREFFRDMLLKLKDTPNAIPVISYNPNSVDIDRLSEDVKALRPFFTSIAFRVTSGTFATAFPIIRELIKSADIFLFDIGNVSHTHSALNSMFGDIKELRRSLGIQAAILNSTKSREITNIGLVDGRPILEIDNSLRIFFKKDDYQFDGFGDYAGVTNELPTSGGSISPAGIYYSYDHNSFIGFRRNRDLSEFEQHIVPTIMKSEYWAEFSEVHHDTCPGCKTIKRIKNGIESGKSQAKWKSITIAHYIYTLSEHPEDL